MRKYIPNTLSIIRLLIAPARLTAWLKERRLITGCTYVVSVVTDILDGYFARKWKVTSKLGYHLDQIADVVGAATIIIIAIREKWLSYSQVVFSLVTFFSLKWLGKKRLAVIASHGVAAFLFLRNVRKDA